MGVLNAVIWLPFLLFGLHAGAWGAGARFMLRSGIVRASLFSAATINLFDFMFFALFFLYATHSLHVRPGLLGLVLGAGAVGGVLGSMLLLPSPLPRFRMPKASRARAG